MIDYFMTSFIPNIRYFQWIREVGPGLNGAESLVIGQYHPPYQQKSHSVSEVAYESISVKKSGYVSIEPMTRSMKPFRAVFFSVPA